MNNGYGHFKAHSNRGVEWNCESPNPAIVRIPFRYDEREGEPAQAASANHLSMKVRLPERPNPPFKVNDHRHYNCSCDLRTPRLFSEANQLLICTLN